MDDQVAVKITADASKVKAGVDIAKGEISGIAPLLMQLNATMTEMASSMKAGFEKVAASAAEAKTQVRKLHEEGSTGFGGMIAKIHEGAESIRTFQMRAKEFAEVYVAMFAVERVAEWGKEFAENAEKVAHLAETFGMTTNQVQQLNAVAAATGIPLETITKGMAILDKNAVNAAGQTSAVANAFKAVGISANDGATQMQRMAIVADKFANMADGPKKTALAMELFGRSGAALIPVLNLGADGIAKITEKATEYNDANTKLSASAQESGHALAESINEATLAWGGITNMLGDAFAPILKEIVDSFSNVAKACVDSYTQGGIVAVIFEEIKIVIEEVGAVINALVGVFVALWNAVSEITHDLVDAIMGAFGLSMPSSMKMGEVGLNLFKDAFVVAKDVIVIAIDLIKGAIVEIIDWLGILAVQAKDALTLNWDKMGADWSIGLGKLKKHVADTATEIKAAMKEAGDAIAAGMKGEAIPDEKKGFETSKGGGTGFDPTLGATKKPKDDLVQQLDDELTAKKLAWSMAQDAQDSAQAYSLASEADYWKEALNRTDLSAKDRAAIETKYLAAHSQLVKQDIQAVIAGYREQLDAAKGNYAAQLVIATQEAEFIEKKYGDQSIEFKAAQDQIIRIKREEADEEKRIQADLARTIDKLRQGEIAAAEQAARFRVQMGVETQSQLLAEETQGEARRWASEAASYDKRIAAEREGSKQWHALTEAQLVAYQQHQSKMTALAQQAALQRTAIERTAITGTANLWGQNIAKLITLQQGFASTIHSLYTGMVGVVSNAFAQIIEQWLAQHLAALLIGGAASKAAGVAEISTAAAIAGANGVASFAAAPWPIDMGAPAFGAGMAQAAGAFSSMLAVPGFATGAYDLSKDQLAMVHSGEMIIPSAEAGGWRNIMTMFAEMPRLAIPQSLTRPLSSMVQDNGSTGPWGGAGAQASPGGPGGDTHNHYTIYAMDGQDVERVLMKHSTKVAKAADHGMRSGYQPKR